MEDSPEYNASDHAENMRFLEENEKDFDDSSSYTVPSTPSKPSWQHVPRDNFYFDGATISPSQMVSAPKHPWSEERTFLRSGQNGLRDATSSLESASSSKRKPDQISMQPPPTIPESSRKRHRDSNGSSDEPAVKSLRATPSPAVTGATTPSSLDSFEIPEDSDLFRLLGDTKADMREMRREQKAQETALQARREQEERDAEFARSLAESMERVQSPEPPSSRAGPSDIPPSFAQAYFDERGRMQRPQAQVSTAPSLPSSPPVTRKQETSSPAFDSPYRFKAERPVSVATSFPNNADFIDLGDDDDDDGNYVDLTGLPSSDLVEVDPGHYEANDGLPPSRRLPWLKTESQIPTVGPFGIIFPPFVFINTTSRMVIG